MNKSNKFLIIAGILFIVALIIFINKQRDSSFNYNGYKVYKTNDKFYNIEMYLKNDVNPHYISSRYNPKELDYIEIEKDIRTKLLKEEIFVTLTPNLTSTSVVALAEIAKVTSNQFLFNIPTHGALTYENEVHPVKTCNNAYSKEAIVLLRLGNKTQVITDKECIILEGTNEDELIKASTRLTLTTLGIMKA